jgi:hypothetical protein
MPIYLNVELDNVPLKILDSRRTDGDLESIERAELIEENFRDLVNSWLSRGHGYETINPHEYIDSEDEDDPDFKEMSE